MSSVKEEIASLRNTIANIIYIHEVWNTLGEVCQALGLPTYENTEGLGKERFLHKLTDIASDQIIIKAAEIILSNYPGSRGKPTESDLQSIQDSLWWIRSQGIQQISNVTRFTIAESLDGEKFWGRLSLAEFFASAKIFGVNCSFMAVSEDGSLFQNIEFNFFDAFNAFSGRSQKPPKWERISAFDFLSNIGIKNWTDQRYSLLLERIVHPEVQNQDSQKKLVLIINSFLQHDGFELRPEDIQGGLPIYKVCKKGIGVIGSPKYIVFASTGPKPDIVISDAVNMDIQVVKNAENCLIYDQPPSSGDLTWEMLVEWWSKIKPANPNGSDLRRELGQRLQASLQSEPEKILFTTYFRTFKQKYGSNLPALLPQVYLHYDPRNRDEREQPVLARQRMDFLLLLNNAVRIVIEIDGIQHYSEKDHQASPRLYAQMVAEDRRIKSLGYEVYRFGGAEFVDSEFATKTIISFFENLFYRYGIRPEQTS